MPTVDESMSIGQVKISVFDHLLAFECVCVLVCRIVCLIFGPLTTYLPNDPHSFAGLFNLT